MAICRLAGKSAAGFKGSLCVSYSIRLRLYIVFVLKAAYVCLRLYYMSYGTFFSVCARDISRRAPHWQEASLLACGDWWEITITRGTVCLSLT